MDRDGFLESGDHIEMRDGARPCRVCEVKDVQLREILNGVREEAYELVSYQTRCQTHARFSGSYKYAEYTTEPVNCIGCIGAVEAADG
jgi:hypothetical protein